MSLVEISGSDAMAAPMPGRVPPPPPRPPPMPRRLPPMFDAFDHTGAGMVWGFPRPAKKRASLKPLHWVKITSDLQGSLWDELQRRHGDSQTAIELDISELETLFFVEAKPEKIRLHDLRRASYRVFNVRSYYMRANNKVINLSMPLPDMMTAVLAMDESVVDVDQIEKLIKFCPTNEEMELLKTYTGDKAALGKYEQYLLELMKVPRLEAKLRVFSFKTQFGTKITELKERLNVVTSACEEVRSSEKLKEIMKKIPCLGNTSNQGPDRVEFKLDRLSVKRMHYFCKLKEIMKKIPCLGNTSKSNPRVGVKLDSSVSDTHTVKSMHYYCKVLASEASELLDVYKDLQSLESASKIQVKSLAQNIQAIIKRLEKLKQELTASETDGPASEVFCNTLKDFISIAETEMATVLSLYSVVRKKADALPPYFGEDPNQCPFEQLTMTLFNFIKLFKKAHEENVKQADLEKKKAMKQIDLRRANDTEIMLTKVNIPLADMMAAVLGMDEYVLDVDQIENLIRFCPTKEEMELLKNYTGDKATLGKCEQYFLEVMKVPGVESKLRAFSFKIQFGTQIAELNKGLNAVNSACEEVRTSEKLKEIMANILCMGNILNQGTAEGSAVGFKLKSLLILSDTCAPNSKMTLMHYLCKVLASKASDLLDFHKDLESLESASKIQLKSLAEEIQAITKGLEKLNKQLTASESDGPVSQVFRKVLKDFISMAETQVATVSSLYSSVGKNADALAHYFGEDPNHYPFEKVTTTLLSFIRLFKKAHEENVKQADLDKNKDAKEAEMEKTK
jgi:formin 2